MLTTGQAIAKLLENVRKGIIDDQETKGISASGKSAQSLRPVNNQEDGQLFGLNYFKFQEFGRRPGKFPPIKDIRDWIDAKGINPTDITKDSLAFLIARKIAREGTDIYQNKRPALALSDITALEVDKSRGEIAKAVAAMLKPQIKDYLFKSLNL